MTEKGRDGGSGEQDVETLVALLDGFARTEGGGGAGGAGVPAVPPRALRCGQPLGLRDGV